MERGVIRDRDGDIWVERAYPGLWDCVTQPQPSVQAVTEAWIEETYGPLEYPRWVQVAKD
jgi:hypothetical protein